MKISDILLSILGLIVAIGIAIGLIVGLKSCAKSGDAKEWNGGHCIKCGGDYKFKNGSYQYAIGDIYFYECEDCGYVIKLYETMS